MMSMALSKVFRTAMTGHCDARPELAEAAIPLEIRVPRTTRTSVHRLK